MLHKTKRFLAQDLSIIQNNQTLQRIVAILLSFVAASICWAIGTFIDPVGGNSAFLYEILILGALGFFSTLLLSFYQSKLTFGLQWSVISAMMPIVYFTMYSIGIFIASAVVFLVIPIFMYDSQVEETLQSLWKILAVICFASAAFVLVAPN